MDQKEESKNKSLKKTKRLKINATYAEGEIKLIKQIIKDQNWLEEFKPDQADIVWATQSLRSDNSYLTTETRVNKIPGMEVLGNKKQLALMLNKASKYDQEELPYLPKTFILPEEYQELSQALNNQDFYIGKPEDSSQGTGIYLMTKMKDIPNFLVSSNMIVQRYIDNPLLIDGKKFDLRLYTLITSLDPFIVYLNDDGLARFCTENYEPPNIKNLKNQYMHLTNYSLNKESDKFIREKGNLMEINENSKRTFSSAKKSLVQLGYNVQDIEKKIEELIVSFFSLLQGSIVIIRITTYIISIVCIKLICNNMRLKEKISKYQEQTQFLIVMEIPGFLKQMKCQVCLSILVHINLEQNFKLYCKIKKEIDEVDFYVKERVATDAFKIVMKPVDKQLSKIGVGGQFNSYKMLMSQDLSEENFVRKYILISQTNKIFRIFESLSGVKYKGEISSKQFSTLQQRSAIINGLNKVDLEILYKKIITQNRSNAMNYQLFIVSLEELAKRVDFNIFLSKLYPTQQLEESMNSILSTM